MTYFKDKKFYYDCDIVTKNDDLMSYSTYWGWRSPQIEAPDIYINYKTIVIQELLFYWYLTLREIKYGN